MYKKKEKCQVLNIAKLHIDNLRIKVHKVKIVKKSSKACSYFLENFCTRKL